MLEVQADGSSNELVFRYLVNDVSYLEEFGKRDDHPYVAYYDGDGRAELGGIRESDESLVWREKNLLTNAVSTTTFGSRNDLALMGCRLADGDNIPDRAVIAD